MDLPQKQPRLPLDITLVLADSNAEVLEAWRSQFEPKFTEEKPIETPKGETTVRPPLVEIHDCDFLEVDADAVIVPGNSFGFLDGGLELRVAERLGLELQDSLRDRIRAEFDAELLVGQALIEDVDPGHPAVVYAPIWRTPQKIHGSVNAFLAARGAFRALYDADRPELKRIAVPALGVDEPGAMNPFTSARQLRYAFETALKKRSRSGKNLTRLIRRERKMKMAPKLASEDVLAED